jgi:diguanylate cyclase (GGDEF)-like protein/PAS domain S-box-containing protein
VARRVVLNRPGRAPDDPIVQQTEGLGAPWRPRGRAPRGERRLRALVAAAPDPLVVVDAHGRIVVASDSFGALTGLDPVTVAGLAWTELVHPDDRHRLVPRGAHAADARTEVRVRSGDGWRHCAVAATDRTADPDVAAVVVAVHDVTARHAAEQALAAAEARYRALVQHSADAMVVLDDDGRIRYVSSSFERLCGLAPAELEHASFASLCHPDDLDRLAGALRDVRRDPDARVPVELRVAHTAEGWRWHEACVSNRLDDPAVAGILLNVRDVADRKRAEELLAREARVHELIAGDYPLATVLEAFACLLEAHVPQSACVIEVLGGEQVVRVAPSRPDLASTVPPFAGADGGAPAVSVAAVAPRSGDRFSVRWSAPVHLDERAPPGAVVSMFLVDRSAVPAVEAVFARLLPLAVVAIDHARTRARLEGRAAHDALTGLPNRTGLAERLRDAVARARDAGTLVAVMHVDLDHFKRVNDDLGHDGGDRLLMAVAKRLSARVRTRDTVARLGGDEFVVVMEDLASPDDVRAAAGRLREALTRPVDVDGRAFHVGASIGVALARAGAELGDVLRTAEDATCRAKKRGRNRVEIAPRGAPEDGAARPSRAAELHEAIEREEFVVHYQPIVQLADLRVVGAEALVRWQHPTAGLLAPGEFVPDAEESGLIGDIGWLVFEQACRFVRAAPRLRVAVNVSARQLTDETFVPRLLSLLRRHDVEPARLKIELTESLLADEHGDSLATLARLRSSGFGVAIDDFGTGYSSLAYLHKLPVTELKIDRSFVSPLGRGREHDSLVVAIVGLAEALGLAVVAEGVETAEQAEMLRTLGCAFAQGYLFGRPQPAEQLLAAGPAMELTTRQM